MEFSAKYNLYLSKSENWRRLREECRDRAGGRCERCRLVNDGEVSHHLHHLTYERRFREDAADLIFICADCHAFLHQKTTLDPATYKNALDWCIAKTMSLKP